VEDTCSEEPLRLPNAFPPQSSSEPFDVDARVPYVNGDGVVNGVSFAPKGESTHPPAPGSVVSIFGAGFASQESEAGTIPLPAALGGVEVIFDGVPARLFMVSPWQINAQVPWNLLPAGANSGKATLTVTRGGRSSAPRDVSISRLSPAIFTFEFGSGPAVAFNPDGTATQPAGSLPGVSSRPALAGDWIVLLAGGLGETDSPVENGANSLDRLRMTQKQPTVLIGGRPAEVLFSGLSPQFVAVYQVNAIVPAETQASGEVSVQLQIGGTTTSETVTIAVVSQ